MLNSYQKAILRAYGKAQLTLKSHAIVYYNYSSNDNGYLVLPCDELWCSYRYGEKYEVIKWMHSHITPDWGEYDIAENDYTEYMHKRFSILFTSNEN